MKKEMSFSMKCFYYGFKAYNLNEKIKEKENEKDL